MNKNILSLVTFLALAAVLQAQNFSISFPATQYAGPPSMLLEAPVTVTNISGGELHLLAMRKTNNLASGHDSYFCWSINCYGPPTSLSPDTVHLAPGASDISFKGYLSPTMGTSGTSVVEYCFFDYSTPNDTVCVTFTYIIDSALSVGELSPEQIFSQPYPNPSNSYVIFNYNINTYKTGEIQIHNLLGSKVTSHQLSDKMGALIIPVKEMKPGIYFATLIANGNKLYTRRLVVSHK